jgi:hypothetical protein
MQNKLFEFLVKILTRFQSLKTQKAWFAYFFQQKNAYSDRSQRDKHEFAIGLTKKSFVKLLKFFSFGTNS